MESERKKELLPFGTAWMELESIMLSEVSHVVKGKYHYDLTYNWNMINKTTKWIKYNQRRWNKEQTDSDQRGGAMG